MSFLLSSPHLHFSFSIAVIWFQKLVLCLKMGESFFLFPLGSPAVPQESLPLLFLTVVSRSLFHYVYVFMLLSQP